MAPTATWSVKTDQEHLPARSGHLVAWFTSRSRTPVLAAVAVLGGLLVGLAAHRDFTMALAVVLGALLVTVLLVRPFYGGLMMVALVPATSGLRTGFPIPGFRLSEVLIGAVWLTLVLTTRREDSPPWGPLDWALLVFGFSWLGFALVDASQLHQTLNRAELSTAFGQVQGFLIYRGARMALRTSRERMAALEALVFVSIPIAVLTLLQQVHFPGIESWLQSITGDVTAQSTATYQIFPRASGPFDSWTTLAGFEFAVVIVICAVLVGGAVPRYRRTFLVAAALSLAALLCTAELSALGCLAIGAVVLAWWSGGARRALLGLATVACVTGLLLGPFIVARLNTEFATSAAAPHASDVPQTVAFRGEIWTQQYLPAIEARPLEGYGVVIPSIVQWQYTESQYVTLATEGGLFLLLEFLLLVGAQLAIARRARASPDALRKSLGRALTVMVVSLIVMDAIWPYMTNAGLPQVLWAMLALAAPLGAAESVPRPRRAPVTGPAALSYGAGAIG